MIQETAVKQLLDELQIRLLKIKSEPDGIVRETMINNFLIDTKQFEKFEKDNNILLVEQLKNYTKEAHCVLGYDEREASDFVTLFYQGSN